MPLNGQKRTKAWRNWVFHDVFSRCKPIRIVDHKHIKVIVTENENIDIETMAGYRILKVKDKTTHSDIYLSNLATKLVYRAYLNAKTDNNHEEKISMLKQLSILNHLCLNAINFSHKDEAKWHKRIAKRSMHIHKTVTGKADHGWEIDELKKAGYL